MDKKAHGGHIASLILGNIAVVAPELIEAGIFGIVVPPYYRITAGKRDYYARGKQDLVQWCAKNFYQQSLDITIQYRDGVLPPVKLTGQAFVDFVQHVDAIGNVIVNIANELSIEPWMVEQMASVSRCLTPETMDTEKIRDALMANKVVYDRVANSLIVSIGLQDKVIPLLGVARRFYKDLRPALMRLRSYHWLVKVSTKLSDELKDAEMTLYQVYEVFRRFDAMMKVEPLKGIGGMESEEISNVCMDPKNRVVEHINSIGDIGRIRDLLGRNSQHKKDLLELPIEATHTLFG